jgi:hypothetical protein
MKFVLLSHAVNASGCIWTVDQRLGAKYLGGGAEEHHENIIQGRGFADRNYSKNSGLERHLSPVQYLAFIAA